MLFEEGDCSGPLSPLLPSPTLRSSVKSWISLRTSVGDPEVSSLRAPLSLQIGRA